ncbi:MAG TPA: VOC family protein [Verrucomicrobiae bacterium]|nr:VOC family protein [Verrucomicrobiae bacterium]
MTMTLYTTVGVSDLARSVQFYDTVFATLGYRQSKGAEGGYVGWGPSYDDGVSFWICKPFDGRPPSPGNGSMVAFRARNAAEVRAFHGAALAHGGSDEGAPGLRESYGPAFYVAYVRDPDGNKLACVFHRYDASQDR